MAARARQRLSSAEAARRLGVKPATLYAYVSRGLLRSERAPDGRTSTFDPAEVERLTRRGRRRAPAAAPDLVIATELTSIEGGTLRYRGMDATELAGHASFEQVAELLWTGRLGGRGPWRPDPAAVGVATACQAGLPAGTLPLDRLRVATAGLAAADELRFELHPSAVVATGRALVAGLVDCLPRLTGGLPLGSAGPPATGVPASLSSPPPTEASSRLGAEAVATRLWPRLTGAPPRPGMVEVLDAALVLAADHELAASAVAARVAASVQADPYAVVGAGLGAVSGALHGGLSLAAETLLAEIGTPERATRVIGDRLRWGEQVPGLGHSLYPDGDPRAACLLDLLGRTASGERLAVVEAVADAVRRRRLPAPNVDFALAALAFVAGMTRGAAETVFALARIAGWLAHALEEYERRTPIRPRAVYTGPAATPPP